MAHSAEELWAERPPGGNAPAADANRLLLETVLELEFFASCISGLEQALADELRGLGIQRVRPLGGGVAFFCMPEQAMSACLWSRLASRILLVVARVNAGDAALLYAGAYEIAWEDVLADDATMAVRAHGTNDELRNTRFTALKVKDAIVDRMRAARDERPVVDPSSPRASIDVRVRGNRATISLDFSGEALNHRAYLGPDDKEDAALACSLAAGALLLGGWPDLARSGAAFLDPACREGIMLVEAALIACDCAPGLRRAKWGFFGWNGFDRKVWDVIVGEAHDRFEAGIARIGGAAALEQAQSDAPDPDRVRFVGTSTSSPFIARARRHVRHAGLRPVCSIELSDAPGMQETVRGHRELRHAHALMVACNIDAQSRADSPAHIQADEAAFVAASALAPIAPAASASAEPSAAAPSGDPSSAPADEADSAKLVAPASATKPTGELAANASAFAPLRSRFIVVGAKDVASRFGVAPAERHLIGRGRIETAVEVFDVPPVPGEVIEIADLAGGSPHKVEVLEASSAQFASRLRKVFKERRKWAARTGVSCYRIYDSDLPDYAVAIDWYAGAGDARGNSYLHVSEYAPPASIDADKARRRFADVLAIAPVVCGIRPDHLFSKTRVREKGGGQYRNAGSHRAYVTTVEEGGHIFEVDLAGRLDTGLFLDHRLTRALVAEHAQDARFLNLFAYTGTASVYAAAGGARETTTVDLSQTYLDWAKRNMAANGFTGAAHRFEKADAMRWITDARRTGRRFDLIFVDPPTFSNSKAMGKRTWDVQRDHVELLIGVSRLLSEEGLAIFSCNLRSFKPYVDDLEKYGVSIEDVSPSTIPEDFSRTPKIHKCYLVRRA